MAGAKAKKLRFWFEIALSIISAAVAVMFIAYVADIYYSGSEGEIYSRAIVWSRLKILIAPLVIWGAMAIACFVLSVVFPSEPKRAKKVGDLDKVARLRRRLPSKQGEEFYAAAKTYDGLEMGRAAFYVISTLLAVVTAVVAVVYLADRSHFSSGEINTDILLLVKNVFPWIVASFALFAGATVYEYATAKAQLKSMTAMFKLAKGAPLTPSPLAAKIEAAKNLLYKYEDRAVLVSRILVAVAAVVFIGLGAYNGSAADVLDKAIKICTECIGLG